jgi:hypothetical protein
MDEALWMLQPSFLYPIQPQKTCKGQYQKKTEAVQQLL